VIVALDIGEAIDIEFRFGLDVFPGYHRDVLLEGVDVDDGLDKRHTLSQGIDVDEIGEDIDLGVC